MKYFIVSESNGHFIYITEDLVVSSPRFQWLKKNCILFTNEDEAKEYVMSKLDEKSENKIDEIVKEYDKIESKEDFEKLFDVKLDEKGYENLKSFIDYLKK